MSREIFIEPKKSFLKFDFQEIWDFRELFYTLVWKELKIRYKQTIIGIVWVLFQPVLTAIIFSIFFGKLAGIPSGKLPYPLFVYLGLSIWTFFSNAVTNASNSLINNESLVKKIYFPRLILPLAAVLTAAVDFIITLLLLVPLLLYFRVTPNPLIIFLLPGLCLILFMFTSGIGLALSAINVRYRDVRYALPFFIQIGLFVTPVIYSINVIYDFRKWVLMLNPLTGIIESLRSLMSGSGNLDWSLITISILFSILIFFIGITYFRKTEDYFADLI